MFRTTLIALSSAALISTSATAGNLISPAEEPTVPVVPEFVDTNGSSFSGSSSGSGPLVLGILGLLVLGGLASGGGS